jgi:hypothetical protein
LRDFPRPSYAMRHKRSQNQVVMSRIVLSSCWRRRRRARKSVQFRFQNESPRGFGSKAVNADANGPQGFTRPKTGCVGACFTSGGQRVSCAMGRVVPALPWRTRALPTLASLRSRRFSGRSDERTSKVWNAKIMGPNPFTKLVRTKKAEGMAELNLETRCMNECRARDSGK